MYVFINNASDTSMVDFRDTPWKLFDAVSVGISNVLKLHFNVRIKFNCYNINAQNYLFVHSIYNTPSNFSC